ncbi:MAG: ATP-dependent RNA helicase DbpA [Proteobacteria bacterium]|nr:ATP-dependent RNA helicase DbpA [Pseudomonadota bacterium]MCP4920010.1 ATP-dependent RNA helicase DbpA [Pseudomonadota bacterium]
MADSFRSLPLIEPLQLAVEQLGWSELTEIQQAALPPLLEGRDVTGQAKTGSGKTGAFGLALLNGLRKRRGAPQALVLCPTRELAEQVAEELRKLGSRMPSMRVLTTCGGRPVRDQRLQLHRGVHVVVGTPGRVAKHLRDEVLDPRDIGMLVLDEADKMLDMGFLDEVQGILDELPRRRQTLLFSATFPDAVRRFSERVQHEPVAVTVETRVEASTLRQEVHLCDKADRRELVAKLLAEHAPPTALIFCETKIDCDRMARFLTDRGTVALALHGDLEQRDRDDVLVRFANGSASVLVATNVAARGLDIPELPLVIVAELSRDPESHVHRIGRTGRAGHEGLALTIVAGEHDRLERLEDFLGRPLERGDAPTASSGLSALRPPNRTLLILGGRRDKLRKGDVLGALCKEGGIPADAIGRIDLRTTSTAVAIRRDQAEAALQALQTGRIKKRTFRAVLLGDR